MVGDHFLCSQVFIVLLRYYMEILVGSHFQGSKRLPVVLSGRK